MKTSYEQIVDISKIGRHGAVDLNAIFALAEQESFTPAYKDGIRRLVLAIDVQKDFMEGPQWTPTGNKEYDELMADLCKGGSLAVPGSIGDVERLTCFIYNNMAYITKVMSSMDTHTAQQIFHPCWWSNTAGDHPAPYTIITHDDLVSGNWRALIAAKESAEYLKQLEQTAKKKLCIWPYHTIEGTEGHTLENEFAKMVYFHSVARKTRNPMIRKGDDPYSEMYGIIKPEYSKNNFINTEVLTAVETYDEIYVAGEAASHCLMESVRQIAEHFANRPEITQKIIILEDCTSPIPGYEAETAQVFDMFKKSYGIRFAKSTDITLAA